MTRSLLTVLVLGASLSDPAAAVAAPARSSSFDGTWNVRLMTEAGGCNASYSYTLAVRNGRVRPLTGASVTPTRVSGSVRRDGRVALGIHHGAVRADASGRLRRIAGAGTWSLSLLGCTGRWSAQRSGVRG